MFLQKKSAREYSAISNNELDLMQVRDKRQVRVYAPPYIDNQIFQYL